MTKINMYHTVTNYCSLLNIASLFIIFIFLTPYIFKYWLKRLYISLYRLVNYITRLPDISSTQMPINIGEALLFYKEDQKSTIENILTLIKIDPLFLFKATLFKTHVIITYILLIYLFYKICFFYEILYVFFILTFHTFSYLSSLLGIGVHNHENYNGKNNYVYSFSITSFPHLLWGIFNKITYYIYDVLCETFKITDSEGNLLAWYTFILFCPTLFIDEVLRWVMHNRFLLKNHLPIKYFTFSMSNGDNSVDYENNNSNISFKNAFKKLLSLNFLTIFLLFIFL